MYARLLVLLPLLTTARFAAAQPLPDRHPFVGVAVDAAGKPVAGAFISIRRQDTFGSFAFWSATTLTGPNGEFRFPQAENGSYYLGGEADGFIGFNATPVAWKSDSKSFKVTFLRLVKLGLSIVNANGSPAGGVAVWGRMWGDGSAGQQTRRGVTNAQGEVDFEALPPANYAIYISTSEGFATADHVSVHANAAQNLQLVPGGSFEAVVQESAAPNKPIGGAKVTLQLQDPEAAAKILGDAVDPSSDIALLAASGNSVALISRDGDGRISLQDVPPGRYTFSLSLPSLPPGAPQTVTIAPGMPTRLVVPLQLKPTARESLTLRLSEKDGRTARGEFLIRALPIDSAGKMRVMDLDGDAPGGDRGRRAVADASGQISLYPLSPGRYRFFVCHLPLGGVEDVQFEAASIDVDVVAGGTTASLVLKG